MADYTPNPVMDASIEAKIDAAFKNGIQFDGVDINDKAQYDALMSAVGLSAEEQRYMAEQSVFKMVQASIGEKIFVAIQTGIKVKQSDIIPCLMAYFEAGDKLEAAE